MLLMVGIYGLILEGYNPGAMVPGVIGGICLLLALYAFQILPVNFAGLALILLGMALIGVELFIPAFGILGIGGIVAVVAGSVILFEGDMPEFRVNTAVIAGMGAGSALVFGGIVWVAARTLRKPRLSSREAWPASKPKPFRISSTVSEGASAGRDWSARSEHPIRQGDKVRVITLEEEGLVLSVTPDAARQRQTIKKENRMNPYFLQFVTFGVVLLAVLLYYTIKILREYERGVVFTLGRFDKVKGPGMIILIPFVQQMVRVDLRTVVMDVPTQDVISHDNVSVRVNAVVYYRVIDPEKAIIAVEHFMDATSQLAQTTLRSVLGKHELDEILAERDKLNEDIQKILDRQTDGWGIKVTNVEIKHVDLDESMIRAIAKQAEAERQRRAKVIHAEGEQQAAQKLVEAAEKLSESPTRSSFATCRPWGNRGRKELDHRLPGAHRHLRPRQTRDIEHQAAEKSDQCRQKKRILQNQQQPLPGRRSSVCAP
jgi:regulator of protease activity HflC (stomatin/prohibitin superfamily)